MPPRSAFLAAALLAAIAVYAYVYHQGGDAPRIELKASREEIQVRAQHAEAVAGSNEVSRDTAARVETTGAEIRQRAAEARERIIERVEAEPVPAGAADPAILHEAREAYAASIRATCRVQRTRDCLAPTAAAE